MDGSTDAHDKGHLGLVRTVSQLLAPEADSVCIVLPFPVFGVAVALKKRCGHFVRERFTENGQQRDWREREHGHMPRHTLIELRLVE